MNVIPSLNQNDKFLATTLLHNKRWILNVYLVVPIRDSHIQICWNDKIHNPFLITGCQFELIALFQDTAGHSQCSISLFVSGYKTSCTMSVSPYGTWKSPITSQLVTASGVTLQELRVDFNSKNSSKTLRTGVKLCCHPLISNSLDLRRHTP